MRAGCEISSFFSLMIKYIFILFLFPLLTFAQADSGSVQFYVNPADCKIMISNTYVKAYEKIKLNTGKHYISIKADSKIKEVKDSITVIKDTTIQYRRILTYSDEYASYLSSLKKYSFKNTVLITTASVTAIAGYGLSYNLIFNSLNKKREAKERALLNVERYNNSYNTLDMDNYKKAYENDKKDYEKYSKQVYYGIPVALATTYIVYKLYNTTKKIKKPEFQERYTFNYSGNYGGVNNFSLVYKF